MRLSCIIENPCHSIRKPLVSTLYGLYVERRVNDLDKTLEDPSIDDIPPAFTAEKKEATARVRRG